MKMKDKMGADAANRAAHIEQRRAAKERQRKAPILDRKTPSKAERQRILIYCEGVNTEPSYFNQFRIPTIDIKCYGEGRNTLSLVERAIDLRDTAANKGEPYDQIWCVFDRDPATTNNSGHTAENFNAAVKLAKRENIGVAYSNQAFEYWLILHFNDHQGSPMPRSDYDAMLNSYLNVWGCVYDGRGNKVVTREIFDVLEAYDTKTGKRRRILACERAARVYGKLDHVILQKKNHQLLYFSLFPF